MTLFLIITAAVAAGIVLGVFVLTCLSSENPGSNLGCLAGIVALVGGGAVALWYGWPLLLALVLSPFQLFNSDPREQRAAALLDPAPIEQPAADVLEPERIEQRAAAVLEPEPVEIDVSPYFAQAGIVRLPDVGLSVADELVGALHRRGWSPTLLGAVKIDADVVAVVLEIVPPDQPECHPCDAPISVAWLDTASGELIEWARDVDRAGSWGHAPPVAPVRLPDGGVGVAMDVGYTNQGVTASGCRVYEITGAELVRRDDLSREASVQRPFRCA